MNVSGEDQASLGPLRVMDWGCSLRVDRFLVPRSPSIGPPAVPFPTRRFPRSSRRSRGREDTSFVSFSTEVPFGSLLAPCFPPPPAFSTSASVTSRNSQVQLGARQLSRVLQVSIRTRANHNSQSASVHEAMLDKMTPESGTCRRETSLCCLYLICLSTRSPTSAPPHYYLQASETASEGAPAPGAFWEL